jgi:multiple sugar transport system permease protein
MDEVRLEGASRLRQALSVLVLVLAAGLTLLPFVVMVAVSLAAPGTVYDGSLLPAPSWSGALANYALAFSSQPLLRFMLNGVVVCGAILVLQILVAAPAGYALAKLPFRGRPLLFGAVVVSLLIPIQVPAIPLYLAIAEAGFLNTYAALVLPFVVSAFAIFLFRQFFLSYPDEVLDAARLDGFSELGIVWRLMLPAAWPAVAAFSTISVIAHWNDLYWPLVVVTRTEMMTPPLGLLAFRASGETTGNVGALMAGGVIVTAPLVLGFLFFQRHLVRGLSVRARN